MSTNQDLSPLDHSPSHPCLKLEHVPGLFAVCKLDAEAPIPTWATTGDFFSVTRTADEMSVVCSQQVVPGGVVCEKGWCCLRVAGAMPFSLVGVLASVTTPIARAGIGVFAYSTYDTDYLFVKAEDMTTAVAALRASGHLVGLCDEEVPQAGQQVTAVVKVNLQEKLSLFSDHWTPKIVGELNGQFVKLVKFRGEFVWHKHESEDELFLVIEGRFRMEFRDRYVDVAEGEFLIVPRGIEHRPVAEHEVHVMLFEPATTVNTGDVWSNRTVNQLERL